MIWDVNKARKILEQLIGKPKLNTLLKYMKEGKLSFGSLEQLVGHITMMLPSIDDVFKKAGGEKEVLKRLVDRNGVLDLLSKKPETNPNSNFVKLVKNKTQETFSQYADDPGALDRLYENSLKRYLKLDKNEDTPPEGEEPLKRKKFENLNKKMQSFFDVNRLKIIVTVLLMNIVDLRMVKIDNENTRKKIERENEKLKTSPPKPVEKPLVPPSTQPQKTERKTSVPLSTQPQKTERETSVPPQPASLSMQKPNQIEAAEEERTQREEASRRAEEQKKRQEEEERKRKEEEEKRKRKEEEEKRKRKEEEEERKRKEEEEKRKHGKTEKQTWAELNTLSNDINEKRREKEERKRKEEEEEKRKHRKTNEQTWAELTKLRNDIEKKREEEEERKRKEEEEERKRKEEEEERKRKEEEEERKRKEEEEERKRKEEEEKRKRKEEEERKRKEEEEERKRKEEEERKKHWADAGLSEEDAKKYMHDGSAPEFQVEKLEIPNGVKVLTKLFDENPNTTIKELVLPGSITKICEYAFERLEALETITMGDGEDLELGEFALYRLNKLKTLTINKNITKISAHSFDSFNKLESVTLTIVGNDVKNCKFSMCGNLKFASITIRSQEIPKGMFSVCRELQEIIIGGDAQSIGDQAFEFLSSLRKITLPSTIRHVSVLAFYQTKLTKLSVEGVSAKIEREIGRQVDIEKTERQKVDEESAKEIARRLAQPQAVSAEEYKRLVKCCINWGTQAVEADLGNVTKLTIPKGVSIDDMERMSGVKYFKNLEAVTFPGDWETIPGYCVGKEQQNLKTIIVSKGTKFIADNAFWDLPEGVKIILPETLVSIGEGCFWCAKLTEIKIPDNVQSLGEIAFTECSELTKVTIGEALKRIPPRCFEKCTKLETISGGKSIEEVDDQAFEGCTKNIKCDSDASDALKEAINEHNKKLKGSAGAESK